MADDHFHIVLGTALFNHSIIPYYILLLKTQKIFILFPWVGHLHQFQDPSVGILYNYADPTVGNLQCSNANMSNARGEGDGHAWN